MADKDSQGPSLELPSLFRRKRAREDGETRDEAAGPADTRDSKPDTALTASNAPAEKSSPADTDDDTAVLPVAGPPERAPAELRNRPRVALPSVQAPRAGRRGAQRAGAAPEAPPARPPAESGRPAGTTPGTAPAEPPRIAAPAAATTASPSTAAGRTATEPRVEAPEPSGAQVTGADQAADAAPRRELSVPELAATTAALVVGAAVGLLGVLLTFLGLQGCQLVAGTSSCGGPGLLVLIAIFVAMVLAGAAALTLFGVPEAGSVSFLGTGLLMVILLLFFLDALDHASMIVVVPAIAAPCFALARWVTTQLREDVMEDR